MTILNRDKILEVAKHYIEQGKFDKAIKEYQKILQADPKDMRVKLRLAELFAKRKQIPEAIRIYREVGAHYAQEGFYLKAVMVYKNILRLNPTLLEINQELATLYEKMGLLSDALHQYVILAQAYEQKNRWDEALKIREKLVVLAPDEIGLRFRLAESYQRQEKGEESILQYEILSKILQAKGGDPKKRIELYERILPHRTKDVEMLQGLVKLYLEAKNYKAASKWLEQFKGLVGGNPSLLKTHAAIYSQLGQFDTARGKYQDLARICVEKGDKRSAIEAYLEILVLLPEEAANIRPLVEGLEAGAFDAMMEKAKGRREIKAVPSEERAQPLEPIKQETAKPARALAAVAPLLKDAKTSFKVAKAYLDTGLEEEAKKEMAKVRAALEMIFELDPGCEEARQLEGELNKLIEF